MCKLLFVLSHSDNFVPGGCVMVKVVPVGLSVTWNASVREQDP